jgi:ferritin-like metal-binding protein YciE
MTDVMERNDVVRSVYLAGLRDAHAVEHQALALMDRQIDHLENYPEVAQRLRAHRVETEHQIKRLDEILDGLGEDHSTIKDATLGLVGNLAALGHTFAPDAILKNSMANFAFENYEVASYKALIAVAESGGFSSAVPLLKATLKEELAMAQFCDEALPGIVEKYLRLRSASETASH